MVEKTNKSKTSKPRAKLHILFQNLACFSKKKTEISANSCILAIQKCMKVSNKVIELSKPDNCKMTCFQVLNNLCKTSHKAYHDCKQFLGLGKCQSAIFKAQIADTTITFMQYNILSVVKRFHSYETIGELFKQALTGKVEFSIVDRIWQILLSVIFAIVDIHPIYCPDLLTKIINENEDIQALVNLNVKLRTPK